ncbi:Uncharacterized protein OBRU01_07281, partial [Operophtera brumata]
MCEWLSCGEWCDVQLLCGGRTFSAHRAVLASVSTFLRRILLSSPDETTTLIVLPDFDLEAMSSVLYYIYNGEVVLQKDKLGLFLEIVKAMQIYIDCQYLSKIQKDAEDKYFELVKQCEIISLPNEIFTLGFNSEDQPIFNIKKCKQSQRAQLKYSQSDSDCFDYRVRCQNESELSESRLGNLKSPYEGRQSNSLLRDLYIGTYPRNGNVNGLTESVLAISNECYQSPASVLLANANCRHLSIDSAHTRSSKKATGFSLHSSVAADEKGLRLTHNSYCNKECAEEPTILGDTADSLSYNFLENIQKSVTINGRSETFLDVDRFIPNDRTTTRLAVPVSEQKLDVSSNSQLVLDPKYQINKNMEQLMFESSSSDPSKCQSLRKKNEMKSKISTKAIFNHSLAIHMRRHSTNARYTCGECDKTFSQLRNFKYHMSIHRGTREFAATCSVCGKRHSTNARYTCGECDKTFSQLRNFKYHMSIHRGTREFAATCSVCGKNRKEYKCSLCPKSFNQRVAYNMHVRIHTGIKPHVCAECGKAFSRKMLLKQHQRTHSGERPYASKAVFLPHVSEVVHQEAPPEVSSELPHRLQALLLPALQPGFHTVLQHADPLQEHEHCLKYHLNFDTASKPIFCLHCKLAFTQSFNMRTHYKNQSSARTASWPSHNPPTCGPTTRSALPQNLARALLEVSPKLRYHLQANLLPALQVGLHASLQLADRLQEVHRPRA